MAITTKSDIIASWAELTAQNDEHGYSQNSRWGTPDMDCSSLCCLAAEAAGFPVRANGASYTGNMLNAFEKSGFKTLPYTPAMELRRGDILLNVKHHAAIYVGNGKIVEAASDENGGISGNIPGDQTGHEIHIRTFYNYPWEYVLRCQEGTNLPNPLTNSACSYDIDNSCTIFGPQIKYKDYGPAVCAAQGALNYHGFGPVSTNGFFSSLMVDAVKRFQTVHKLEIDGIIGPETWRALMYWR